MSNGKCECETLCVFVLVKSSVTRLGEILLLWQTFYSHWETVGIVLLWYLANFCTYFDNLLRKFSIL